MIQLSVSPLLHCAEIMLLLWSSLPRGPGDAHGAHWAPFSSVEAAFFFLKEKLTTENEDCDIVGGIPSG